ncbi:tyrosine-type recombinase/integrase [Lactobacillus gasseri]|uniref:tyrosine-type recombinase/integrase n=1 Tax=Lactobacillus gasseri TaxID=1596 RepID=UPI001194EE51|nr:site-specific integrase [Lactobacillus gasseri]TVU93494.1 tyrosine-type recombinase/integrase [Lactobacillus gasseri]TVV14787.1 tyrosine-type recombinase/integrase [Lactobacillus gasseri]
MIKKIDKGKHKGEYQVRIQPRDKVTGKQISWPVQYANTKQNAIKLERKMWADFEDGLNFGDANSIFADEFQKYVDDRAKAISPVTLKSWQQSANSFKEYFGNAKIRQITTSMVSQYAHDYVEKHNASVSKSSTISKRLVHLRNYFKSLEGKAVKENPVPEKALKLFFRQSEFSLPKEWYIFSKEELDQIRAYLYKDLKSTTFMNAGSKLAILIESYTGMRVGELQALRFKNLVHEKTGWTFRINDSWSDYTKDFNGALKARAKGVSRELLPVPDDLVDLIKAYEIQQKEFLKDHNIENIEDLVFLNIQNYKYAFENKPITQHGLNYMFKNICNKLDIKPKNKQLSLYCFRHTICTQLANVPGMSYPWAARKMGHSLDMFMKTYVGIDKSLNSQMDQLWLTHN